MSPAAQIVTLSRPGLRSGKEVRGISRGRRVARLLRVVSKIGGGGRGESYVARNEHDKRLVAIKVFDLRSARRSGKTLEGYLRRIEKETQVWKMIRDPHLVAVYGVHETVDLCAVEMELVQGMSIERLVKSQGPLGLESALQVASGVAQGLKALHDHGVIHRDLRSSNVIVGPGGVKIADLGYALEVKEAANLRVTGGAPGYTAPEGFLPAGVSPACDVWSLGVVLLEMLGGSVSDLKKGDEDGGVRKALTRVKTLREDVPREFEALIREMLSEDPVKRPMIGECLNRLGGIRFDRLVQDAAGSASKMVSSGLREVAGPARGTWDAVIAALGSTADPSPEDMEDFNRMLAEGERPADYSDPFASRSRRER